MRPLLAPLLPAPLLLAAPALALPPSGADGGPAAFDPSTLVGCGGGSPTEALAEVPGEPDLRAHVRAACLPAAPLALDLGRTDCPRTTYGLLGYRWATVFSVVLDPANGLGIPAADAQAALQGALDAWDDATPAEIAGGVVLGGSSRNVGRLDGVNQAGFIRSMSTLLVATTWYHASTGVAVEHDVGYNGGYGFSIGGSPTTLDLQAITTHVFGNNFGPADLDDPADACLTMYRVVANGETHQRTLGDGDALGVQALYGG